MAPAGNPVAASPSSSPFARSERTRRSTRRRGGRSRSRTSTMVKRIERVRRGRKTKNGEGCESGESGKKSLVAPRREKNEQNAEKGESGRGARGRRRLSSLEGRERELEQQRRGPRLGAQVPRWCVVPLSDSRATRSIDRFRRRFFEKNSRSFAHDLFALSLDAASQVATRAITFALNLLTTRLLTVDAYGVREGEFFVFCFLFSFPFSLSSLSFRSFDRHRQRRHRIVLWCS